MRTELIELLNKAISGYINFENDITREEALLMSDLRHTLRDNENKDQEIKNLSIDNQKCMN